MRPRWEKLHTIAPLVKLGQKMEKFINVMCKYMGKSQIWSKKKIYTKWVIFWFVWIAVQKSAKFKSSKVRDFRTFEPSKVQRSVTAAPNSASSRSFRKSTMEKAVFNTFPNNSSFYTFPNNICLRYDNQFLTQWLADRKRPPKNFHNSWSSN